MRWSSQVPSSLTTQSVECPPTTIIWLPTAWQVWAYSDFSGVLLTISTHLTNDMLTVQLHWPKMVIWILTWSPALSAPKCLWSRDPHCQGCYPHTSTDPMCSFPRPSREPNRIVAEESVIYHLEGNRFSAHRIDSSQDQITWLCSIHTRIHEYVQDARMEDSELLLLCMAPGHHFCSEDFL